LAAKSSDSSSDRTVLLLGGPRRLETEHSDDSMSKFAADSMSLLSDACDKYKELCSQNGLLADLLTKPEAACPTSVMVPNFWLIVICCRNGSLNLQR